MKIPAKRARGRPPTGNPQSAAERMRRMRQRRKEQGFRSVTRWLVDGSALETYSDHRRLDMRSLAMHTVIAKKITRDPKLLEVARTNLERWHLRWEGDEPNWFRQWQAVMKRPWPQIAALITDSGELADRLRQSSPFAGVLSPAERKRIYEAFRA